MEEKKLSLGPIDSLTAFAAIADQQEPWRGRRREKKRESSRKEADLKQKRKDKNKNAKTARRTGRKKK